MILHLPCGLELKSISELYTEAHIISNTRTRLLGDITVNHVLNCRVQRESQYIRKNCISVTAEAEYTSALGRNTVQMEIPDFSHESQLADKRKFIEEVRQEAKTI